MYFSIGVIASFIIIAVIGMLVSRKVSSAEDYYVSGRNAPTILIVGSLVASYFSTVTFMGEVGTSYDGYPIIMLTFSAFNACGYVLGAFLFGRYLRRSKALTLPEFFGQRFKSIKVRRTAAIITILGLGTYLVAVTQGASLLLSDILGVNFVTALVIIWITYTSFTFMGGAKGVIITDTVMFFFFALATFISVPFILKAAGGWPNAIPSTAALSEKPNIFSWHGITGDAAFMGTSLDAFLWAAIIGLSWGVVIAISPWQASRYMMAKNEHVIIRTGIIATISILVIYLFLHITIATVNVVNPNINPSELVYIWSAQNIMPTWVGVIVISGIMAAALSSCSTFLQLIGNSVAHDLFQIKSDKGSKALLKTSRIAMIIVGFVILIVTIYPPPAVMWIGFFAATVFAASWGPVAFASIHSKTATKEGAFWSMILGAAGVVVGEIIGSFIDLPIYLEPVIVGAVLSLLALYIVSKFSTVTKEERTYRESLLKTPEGIYHPKDMILTKRLSYVLMATGAVVIIITFAFYYQPLQSMTVSLFSK